MNFLLCGKKGTPAVLLIHGEAMSAESCYEDIARALGRKYRVIMACLDGHDPYSDSLFESLTGCCERIEKYIHKRFGGRLWAISGFSLGGTVALELVKRGNIKVSRLHLDAPLCHSPGLKAIPYTLMFTKGAEFIKKGHKLPDIVVEKVYGKGNAGMQKLFYKDIDMHSVENLCTEMYSYKLSPRLERCRVPVELWCGSEEKGSKQSARDLEQYIPKMRVRVFKGFGHGQILRAHKRAYVRELKAFLA